MIELRAGETRVCVHALAALLPLLGLALGLHAEVLALMLSLCAHEAGHMAAARLARVRVCALTVMPFGCGLQLGNVYALSPAQVFWVSAGGPLASLLLLFADGAMAHWGMLSPAFALSLLQITLTLLLFNLLPALPLDGGRMLYALTVKKLGRARAAALAARLGVVVAAALIAGTVFLCVRTRRLNLTLPFCAAFILKGIAEDRRALSDAAPASLLNALRSSDAPTPMRLCAVCAEYPVLKALRFAAPDAATLYALYRGGAIAGFVDERALLSLALARPGARVEEAMKNRPSVA